MTDTPNEAAGPGLDLDPGQVAAMREQWIAAGLDAAKFDHAASGDPEPAEPGAEAPDAPLTNLKIPTVTEAQAQAMAAELIAAGASPEQVEAAMREDGFTPADDSRTDEEKEFDRSFGAAPPEAHKIDFAGRILPGLNADQLAGANAEFTAWLSAVGFPPEIGPAVVERALDVAHHCQHMAEPARELFRREQDATFVQMAGSEERALELADFAEVALERGGPAIRAALEASGALDDAGVVMHLAHQGERLSLRSRA